VCFPALFSISQFSQHVTQQAETKKSTPN